MSCYRQLGLPDEPRPSVDDVKQAWRRLAAQHHPDRGGDANTFARLRQAYEEALSAADQPRSCPDCQGLGRVKHIQGWVVIALFCQTCDGRGTIDG